MDERQKIKEELAAQNAPLLHAQQGQVPKWELPPGYLDQLADRTLALTEKEPVAKLRRLRVVARWAVAAVAVLALGFWWQSDQLVPPTDQLAEVDLEAIPLADLQQYISDNIEDFELDLLAASVQEASPGATVMPPDPKTEISTEALEEFLEAEDGWLDDLEDEEWF